MKNEREVLIPLFPTDPYHKLLFARKFIKEQDKLISELRVEIGKLKAENDELRHTKSRDVFKKENTSLQNALARSRREKDYWAAKAINIGSKPKI